MSRRILVERIGAQAFAPFGDVMDAQGAPDKMINQNRCGRYHDRARLDFTDGTAGISIFQSKLVTLPLMLELVERHPLGSQAFVPMSPEPFLVVVAPDEDGTPGLPRAFITQTGQAINLHRNVWHGVLTPLAGSGLFAVIDRIGGGNNLEEHWFAEPYVIEKQADLHA